MTDRNLVLSRLKEGLSQAFGHRFRGIVLFTLERKVFNSHDGVEVVLRSVKTWPIFIADSTTMG